MKTNFRLPPCPNEAKHRNDVSDSHSVPSHPVCPARTIAVIATSPTPAPCTVTDPDPVPALFLPPVTLILPSSTEYPSDMLPDRSPAVITMCSVDLRPCPTRHRTDVSDSHSVPSHPVSLALAMAVYATRPILPPCTVTDDELVPALFA